MPAEKIGEKLFALSAQPPVYEDSPYPPVRAVETKANFHVQRVISLI